MKKWSLFLSVYLCLCLLASCAAPGGGDPVPGGAPSNEPQAGGETTQPAAATIICRVVSGAEEGNLLLAGQDGGDYDVYHLSVGDLEIRYEDPKDAEKGLRNGALVEVGFSGNIMETFPAQLGDVTGVKVLSDGFDDLCGLYLGVLNDLWDVDHGLNSDITELGVDLSKTRLTPAEQAALAWAFGQAHGMAPIQGTWEELADQGYIDREFLYWEEGCLFSITEQETEGTRVTFDAEKWRSGLGAYFFVDCTSAQSAGGEWADYTIGSEAIS